MSASVVEFTFSMMGIDVGFCTGRTYPYTKNDYFASETLEKISSFGKRSEIGRIRTVRSVANIPEATDLSIFSTFSSFEKAEAR